MSVNPDIKPVSLAEARDAALETLAQAERQQAADRRDDAEPAGVYHDPRVTIDRLTRKLAIATARAVTAKTQSKRYAERVTELVKEREAAIERADYAERRIESERHTKQPIIDLAQRMVRKRYENQRQLDAAIERAEKAERERDRLAAAVRAIENIVRDLFDPKPDGVPYRELAIGAKYRICPNGLIYRKANSTAANTVDAQLASVAFFTPGQIVYPVQDCQKEAPDGE